MSEFDNDLKVGDIITAYHSGYHRVINIERRFYDEHDEERRGFKAGTEYSSLIQYETIANSKGVKRKNPGVPKHCDAAYCKKLTLKDATDKFNEEVAVAQAKLDTVKDILSL